ncbi:MAG: nucleotidyltransferase family protein [Pseudomonadota bacterium]
MENICSIILAAGKSTRMSSLKPLKMINSASFLDHTMQNLAKANITKFFVVVGYRSIDVINHLSDIVQKDWKAYIVVNENFELGQFSSLQKVANHLLYREFDYCLISLIDHPFVKTGTIKKLLDKLDTKPKPKVIIPRHKGELGHPIIIHKSIIKAMSNASASSNLRLILEKYIGKTEFINVNDPCVLDNFNYEKDIK